jgi:hypothetical protein
MIQVGLLRCDEVIAGETPQGAHDEHGHEDVHHHTKIVYLPRRLS